MVGIGLRRIVDVLALLLVVSIGGQEAWSTSVSAGNKIVQVYDFTSDTPPPYTTGLVAFNFMASDPFTAGESFQLDLRDSTNSVIFTMFSVTSWGSFQSIGVGFTLPSATNDTNFIYELVMLTGSIDVSVSLFLRQPAPSFAFTSSGPVSETVVPVTPSAVPLPAALPLFGTGLAIMGLIGWHRRRRRAVVASA